MIGATQTAVECMREGLEEPSNVMPFFEPYLPFYDAVRDEPAFIEMLADIDGTNMALQEMPSRQPGKPPSPL